MDMNQTNKLKTVWVNGRVLLLGLFLVLLLGVIVYEVVFETSGSIYAKNINNVVEVYSYNSEESESFGTGWFISETMIMTNYHVISYLHQDDRYNFEKVMIRFYDEVEYSEVSIVKYDESLDIAILEYAGDHKHNYFDMEESFSTGDDCFSIGNFNNQGLSFRQGYISLAQVVLEYNDVDSLFIQCDIDIGLGDSGAVLLDKKGNVIGMITLRTKNINGTVEQGIAYAIPAKSILVFLNNS